MASPSTRSSPISSRARPSGWCATRPRSPSGSSWKGRARSRIPASPASRSACCTAALRTLDVHLAVPFAISRAVRTEKRVVLVELREGDRVAYGEGSPDPFFGETSESIEADVRGAFDVLPEDPRDLATLRARLDARF